MSSAIWAIRYRVAGHDRDRYLQWFHEVHIPDKLARPGYTWAAHYQCDATVGAAGSSHSNSGSGPGSGPGEVACLALFGGDSTRVFYDPSPAQLKVKQDALTREMMGCRIASGATVYGEEWRHREGGADAIGAPAVYWLGVDVAPADEQFAAWCAQTYFPAAATAPGCTGVRKLFGSSGSPRHVVVEEFSSASACRNAVRAMLAVDPGDVFGAGLAGPDDGVVFDRRLWPPVART